MTILLFLLFLALTPPLPLSTSASSNVLTQGSSLSVEKTEDVLVSPSGIFSAGFFSVGENAYYFAIWFSEPSCNGNCTVVWIANRDLPVNGKASKLTLQKTGNLILTDASKSTAWSTETQSVSPAKLLLYDTGNLALENLDNVTLWQSFDSPTDTLLPSQKLTRDSQLVSSRSQTNFSTGFYRLFFDNDNIMRLVYDGPDVSSLYWPEPWLLSWEANRYAFNSTRIASIDSFGRLSSSDNYTALSADYGAIIQRKLTMDFDGNLRIYSRDDMSSDWTVSWQALSRPCEAHAVCGPNSTCSYDLVFGRRCSCIPGYRMRNNTDWSYGCEPEFSFSCRSNDSEADFIRLTHVEFYGYDLGYHTNVTLEMCKRACLESCLCKGFQFKFSYSDKIFLCYPKLELLNGRQSPDFNGDIYVRVPKSSDAFSYRALETSSGLDCRKDGVLNVELDRGYSKKGVNGTVKSILAFASALGGVELLGILSIWVFLNIRNQKDSEGSKEAYQLAPTGFRRFTYSELKRATRNFMEEIGRGSGGIVYKGKLSDGQIAAVKRLNAADQGEAEFLAEISTIGRLNHMNLIDVWGYCAEGSHRLLVYEYMEHGSLAESLATHSESLDWGKRFEIALGTARGLAYLHEECLEWVLHCDVKPQNILLDAKYQPKVSDFGLSKLLNRGDASNSSFSRIRGTRGYMAPEWVLNLPITSKVDVYSYGIVVLEMVAGKSPAAEVQLMSDDGSSGAAGRGGLVMWVREKRRWDTDGGKGSTWIEEIMDPMMGKEFDKTKMEFLVTLALQCVEEDKDARPTMREVFEMLLRIENDN